MKKKSMDDPIKRKWRHKEYNFIKKHREKLGDYGTLTVAFLPGVSCRFSIKPLNKRVASKDFKPSVKIKTWIQKPISKS